MPARVLFDPGTGQGTVPRDAQGRPIVVPDLEGRPAGGLPEVTVTQNGTTVTLPAVSAARLATAWEAHVDHQAPSLGAPFGLRHTPDEDGAVGDDLREQADTETAFIDLGDVHGELVTARVAVG